MTYDDLYNFVHQPQTKIVDDLSLPPCQAALDILKHLEAIKTIMDS